MNSLYPQGWENYLSVLLVFLRLLGLFLLAPLFSHKAIPGTVRTAFAFGLSLALYPVVAMHLPPVPMTIGGLAVAALRESAVGFLLGFGAHLTFEGINLAAQFIGYQMGFGTAGLIDPQNQSSVSMLVPLHGWLALMVFLMADMHFHLLQLFVLSFQATAKAKFLLSPELLAQVVGLTAKLFLIAIQMAAPFTLLVLAVNLVLGVISRMMPQMNVMLFTFPVTILLGFSAIYLLAPELLDYLERILGEISSDLMGLMRAI